MRERWKALVLLGAVLSFGVLAQIGCSPVQAQLDVPDGEERTIRVDGSGVVAAEPDEVVLRLGVETIAETAREALSQNSERMQTVIEALKEEGVPAEGIQTSTVSLSPQYDEAPSREPDAPRDRELVGYRARNTVEVRSKDLEAVGELLDLAVDAGANRVQGIRFEVSNATELLSQARDAAWEDAKQKAEQLASLADSELGEARSIRESTRVPRPVELEAAAEREAAVPIEPGTERIRVDLEVTWALQ